MALYTEKRAGGLYVFPQADVAEAMRQARIAENAVADIGLASIKAERIRRLTLLRNGMARTQGVLPVLAAAVPAIGAPTAATAIVTGTTWQVSSGGNPLHAAKYTFVGANWKNLGSTYPNGDMYKPEVAHLGNGSDPLVTPLYGGRVRFVTESPDFEINVQCALAGNGNVFRLKADGQYLKVGSLGVDAVNGALRFIRITWGAGGAADRKLRHYELEFHSAGQFIGIRTENIYKPAPWPQPDKLRVIHHGDSIVGTIVDSGDDDTGKDQSLGNMLANLLGQSDYWVSGTGGAGWFTPIPHGQSWFNDRVTLDVVGNNPEVIIEHGGGNDQDQLTAGTITQAAFQAAVELWLDTVIAAHPAVMIFMFGPIICGSGIALGHTRARDAKAAAAAKYPRNVAFIDTLTDPWVFGTGRQGATNSTGNRDWVTGTDGSHPTMEGHVYLAGRIYRGVAGAIPALLAANL